MAENMTIKTDYANDAGKMGRHNLSFRTGAHIDKKKREKKYACRKKFRKQDF